MGSAHFTSPVGHVWLSSSSKAVHTRKSGSGTMQGPSVLKSHRPGAQLSVLVVVCVIVVFDVAVSVPVVVVVLSRQRINPSPHVPMSVSLYLTQNPSLLSLTQGPDVPAMHSSPHNNGSGVGASVRDCRVVTMLLSIGSPKHSYVFGGHVRDDIFK